MNLQRKLKRFYSIINKMRHCRKRNKYIITFSILMVLFIIYWFKNNYQNVSNSYCVQIDAVYTWVNGSESSFIEAARKYDPNYDISRFDDKNELRYSLRSLEKYAPWIRRVYIVTNGQIPYWLDLNYDRVTIVPHEVLAPNAEDILPTFSSAAIETFIHRIPQLSKIFLYLNDDIFLGEKLYPEDLYTDADGVRIYQAWMVPDCAEDCPWTYIGDGVCDRHCNIKDCQYDGGDCSIKNDEIIENDRTDRKKYDSKRVNDIKNKNDTKHFNVRSFPNPFKIPKLTEASRNSTVIASFKHLLQHRNVSTLKELRQIVDNYNHHLQVKTHEVTSTISSATSAVTTKLLTTIVNNISYKSSQDIYSQSLIHTNMLLNQYYGFKTRNVLAHVGFLLDRQIIDEMHKKFSKEIQLTASHKFRAINDLQFAFTYYSFVMSEMQQLHVGDIFDEFDTDNSGTWSDREIRTFLTRIYPLPLDWSVMRFFEEVLSNCTRDTNTKNHVNDIIHSTLVYERYEDSNLPTITRDLVMSCTLLAEALELNFGTRQKYRFIVNSKRAMHSNFMMLKSNITDVVDALDKMRRNPRKFNCINDNLESQYVEENELIRQLLEDFYLSFFPQRSKFELKPQYRNRFSNWQDYQKWRRRKRAALAIGYVASVILILFILRFVCAHKAKFVRRYVQRL